MSQEQLPGGKKKSISPSVKPLNISETLSNSKKALNKVRVVHGANEQYFDVVGRSVGSVRKSLRDAMSIPSDAEAIVCGKKLSDDFILDSGQNLEFHKEAGVKGSRIMDHLRMSILRRESSFRFMGFLFLVAVLIIFIFFTL